MQLHAQGLQFGRGPLQNLDQDTTNFSIEQEKKAAQKHLKGAIETIHIYFKDSISKFLSPASEKFKRERIPKKLKGSKKNFNIKRKIVCGDNVINTKLDTMVQLQKDNQELKEEKPKVEGKNEGVKRKYRNLEKQD